MECLSAHSNVILVFISFVASQRQNDTREGNKN